MSVYQVEEYYIHIDFKRKLTGEEAYNVEVMLVDEGYTNFEFQDFHSVIVVDDIESESVGEQIQGCILKLASGGQANVSN